MDMHQIRLKNLLLVIEQAGSQARLADYVGIKSSYISQIKSPTHPTNMGNDIARRIEKAMNLPFGWMDHLHDESTDTETTSLTTNNQNSYTSSRKADTVIKDIINSVNSGALSDDDIALIGTLAKKIKGKNDHINYSTHYPGLIDEDT